MKKLFDASKKQVLEKLKYISSLMDYIADILKSFAMAIGSLVAGTTAGVTGYYEIKKVIKKERIEIKAMTSSGGSGAYTVQPAPAPAPTYSFDTNSGTFLASIVILGLLIFLKLKKKVIS